MGTITFHKDGTTSYSEKKGKKMIQDDEVFESYFFRKSIFVIFIGLVIWMISTILFGGTVLLLTITLPFYIFSIIMYFILWITVGILAYMKYNIASMIMFFITAFVTGIVEAPIITWAAISLGSIEFAITLFLYASILGVIATGIALFIGYYFRERISKMTGIWMILIIFGLILLFVELIFGFIYQWEQYILITTPLVLIWIFGTIIWDGSRLTDYDNDEWMILSLTIFLDLIIVIVRIFILLVASRSNK